MTLNIFSNKIKVTYLLLVFTVTQRKNKIKTMAQKQSQIGDIIGD